MTYTAEEIVAESTAGWNSPLRLRLNALKMSAVKLTEELAERVEPRSVETVRRYITGVSLPPLKHREAITDIVGLTENQLWANLNRSADVVDARAVHYGPPEVNFERIALGWKAILGCDVTIVQVALAMDWVKTSRLISSPDHSDSWLDKFGYTAIGEALALNK